MLINLRPPYRHIDREMAYLQEILEANTFGEFESGQETSVGQPEGREAEMVAAACELEVSCAIEQAGRFFVDGAAGA